MASLVTNQDRTTLENRFGITSVVCETLPDELERTGQTGQRWRSAFTWNARSVSVKWPGRPSRAFASACLSELVPGVKGGWL